MTEPEIPGQQTTLESAPGKTDETITRAQELHIELRSLLAENASGDAVAEFGPSYPHRLQMATARAIDFLLERYIVEG